MSSSRKVVAGLLILGIGTCIALLPWQRWLSGVPTHERILGDRVARYIELRKSGDWNAVYALMDPRDRARKTQFEYLRLVGNSPLKVHEMTDKAHTIDWQKGTATVTLSLDCELNRASLPAYIQNLKADPGSTRKTDDFQTDWAWSEGTWWLRMDREVLTGKTADGRLINPQGPQPPPANSSGTDPAK